MPGSWEIKEGRKVLLYSIHTEVTTIAWAAGFRNLVIPGSYTFVSGMPYDHARNEAVRQFLASPFEYLFALDSDVIPPSDAILRLLNRRVPIVSGIYYRRSPPHGVPVMMKNGRWLTEFPENSLIDVDLVGNGCLLVHRSVFERVPPLRPGKPWYDWRVDLRGTGLVPDESCLSEDFTWNWWVRKHGLKIHVSTDIICRHVGYGQAIKGGIYPLEATPHT